MENGGREEIIVMIGGEQREAPELRWRPGDREAGSTGFGDRLHMSLREGRSL